MTREEALRNARWAVNNRMITDHRDPNACEIAIDNLIYAVLRFVGSDKSLDDGAEGVVIASKKGARCTISR